jgi:hypothetical protein
MGLVVILVAFYIKGVTGVLEPILNCAMEAFYTPIKPVHRSNASLHFQLAVAH